MQLSKSLPAIFLITSLGLSGTASAAFDVWDSPVPWQSLPSAYAGWDVFSLTVNFDNTPDLPGSGPGTFVANVPGSVVQSDGNILVPSNTNNPAYTLRLAADPDSYHDVYVRFETLRSNAETLSAVINFENDDGSITQYTGVQTVSYLSDPNELGTANEQEYFWKFSTLPGAYAYIVSIAQNSGAYTVLNLAEIAAVPVKYVTPVPESQTYAMMLMGLGLMGFIARRRKISSL
jgi:hypothetical protein